MEGISNQALANATWRLKWSKSPLTLQKNALANAKSGVTFGASEVIFAKSGVTFGASGVTFVKSEVTFVASEVIFVKSEGAFGVSEVIFEKSEVTNEKTDRMAGNPLLAQTSQTPGLPFADKGAKPGPPRSTPKTAKLRPPRACPIGSAKVPGKHPKNSLTLDQRKRKNTEDGYAKTPCGSPAVQISSQFGWYPGLPNYWLGRR